MLTVSALAATTLGPPAGYQAVDQEHDNCPDDRHGEASEVEPYHIGPSCELLEDEPPDEGARDPEQHGDDAAARVPARHEQLRDDARDEAEDYPG